MAKTLCEAINLLNRLGKIDLVSMGRDSTETVCSRINHKYRPEILIPFVGIADNIAFALTKGGRYVTTSDNVYCKVSFYEEKHIFDMEDLVKTIYGIDTLSFLKRWYATNKDMDSLHFVHLKLERNE